MPDPDLEMVGGGGGVGGGHPDRYIRGREAASRAPLLDPPLKCKRGLQIPIINLELLLFPKGWGSAGKISVIEGQNASCRVRSDFWMQNFRDFFQKQQFLFPDSRLSHR